MNNTSEKFLPLILALFFTVYSGYQIFRLFDHPLETETALPYTISDSLSVTGVIIRDERIIDRDVRGQAVSYLLKDGSKVTPDTAIAEIYISPGDLKTHNEIRLLEPELERLRHAADNRSAQFGNAQTLSKQALEKIDDLVVAASGPVLGDISSQKLELLMLLNRKELATGKSKGFDLRIAELEQKIASLRAAGSQSHETIKSAEYGFFAKVVDGMENVLNTDGASSLKVSEIENYAAQRTVAQNDKFGKVITDHNWFYAAIVSREELSKFTAGTTVTLGFNLFGLSDIPFTVYETISDETSENSVVLLRSNYVMPELTAVRNPSAQVVFRSYSGLRISKRALRYDGLEKGVYIIENSTVKFKTINVVYEGEDFLLCGSNPDNVRPLEIYRQVIIEGKDLYEDKFID